MRRSFFGPAVLAFALLASPLAAQDPARRDSLALRVQARMQQVLRTQVGMTDEQIARYQEANRKFEQQRRTLFVAERRTRMEIRDAVVSGDTAQNARIGQLLDRTLQLQRQRLDLMEAEQKEYATFLTPVQRARLFGVEEQLRRRMMEMGQPGGRPPQGGDSRRGPPRRPPGAP